MALKVGCAAEYEPIKTIVLCEPGPELLYALIWPQAANFEKAFDSLSAIQEHKDYQQYLRRHGLAVHNLSDLLAGNPNLINHAVNAVSFNNFLFPLSRQDVEKNIEALGPYDRIRLILERPTLTASKLSGAELHSATVSPVPNLYFMRDQLVVTDRGIILGKFKNSIRQAEQDIVKLAIEVLGISVTYEIVAPGVLEGGDFIPAGDWGLIGCGERTNRAAIDQLITLPGANALGYTKLAVIEDPTPDIQEMHLDTYFMLIGSDTCVVVDTRVNPPDPGADDKQPKVDIFDKRSNGEYKLLNTCNFKDFLHNYLGMKNVIQLTEEDQRAYGINVLCLSDKRIVGSRSREQDPTQLRSYEQKLATALVKYDLLDFTNLRKGFGSNHCMSQVYERG